MAPSLPTHITTRTIPSKGTGLFTTKRIEAGELVFKDERPLITVLDSARLRSCCEWCLVDGYEGGDGLGGLVEGKGGQCGDGGVRLRACTGCRIVRFCSKTCQSSSWRHAHKFTCPIYKRLYPKVLPNTVRAVLELLVRRSQKLLADDEWQAFMILQSHSHDFQRHQEKNEDGLTTWQTIELMSQAAMLYSGTKEPLSLVQEITARILTNTHTLTTPTLDPLGLSLSLKSSRLNHSCKPNTCITFSGPSLSLRALISVPADTELTISYIDTTLPPHLRRAELLNRYFFTCTCEACSLAPTTAKKPEDEFPATIFEEANQLLHTAKTTSDPQQAYTLLSRALSILDSTTPKRALHVYPSPSIRHQMMLTALSLQKWTLALEMSIQGYCDIDPVLFPQEWHPVRVVHVWVLLRLVVQVAEIGDGLPLVPKAGGKGGEREIGGGNGDEGIKWHLVIWKLWKEVSDQVPKSHGMESAFAKEVAAFGMSVEEGYKGFETQIGTERAKAVMEGEWVRFRGRISGVKH